MKTFVVAEIGSNWEGDLTKAKKIIRNCKIKARIPTSGLN